MLLMMVGLAIYMYIQPYQGLGTNILEVGLLVDILLMVIITSIDHFKVTTCGVLTSPYYNLLQATVVFNKDHSFSIDQCGNVDQISEHAAVLIPFYFLPLIILFGLVAKEIYGRIKTVLKNRLALASSVHFNLAAYILCGSFRVAPYS